MIRGFTLRLAERIESVRNRADVALELLRKHGHPQTAALLSDCLAIISDGDNEVYEQKKDRENRESQFQQLQSKVAGLEIDLEEAKRKTNANARIAIDAQGQVNRLKKRLKKGAK